MPGGGTAMCRRWKSRSKFGSSIQYGWSSPSGTSTSRRRNGGRMCRRASSAAPTLVERAARAGLGSYSVTEPTWPNCAARLHVQEARVQTGELLHQASSGSGSAIEYSSEAAAIEVSPGCPRAAKGGRRSRRARAGSRRGRCGCPSPRCSRRARWAPRDRRESPRWRRCGSRSRSPGPAAGRRCGPRARRALAPKTSSRSHPPPASTHPERTAERHHLAHLSGASFASSRA